MIKNTENAKMYIGSSTNIENRWKQHMEMLQSCSHHSYKLQNDYNKYGITKFTFTVLEITTDTNKLLSCEQKWIDEYESYLDNVGYNILSITGVNVTENNNCNIGLIEVSNYHKTITEEQKHYLKKNLNITSVMNFTKYQQVFNDEYSLTKKWFGRDKENRKIIKRIIINYCEHIVKAKSNSIYWTTFITYQREVQGKGYTRSYISLDAKPNEKRNNLVFAMNLYPNSFIKNNITENISNDEYALSLILKWIIDVSQIKNPINIFIPSMRMYKLLNDWLNDDLCL